MDGVEMPVIATDSSASASAVARAPDGAADATGGPERSDPTGPPARVTSVSWALRVAIVPWVLARVLVGVVLAGAHELAAGDHLSAPAAARVHQGLLGWDAGWYESIAGHGYAGAGHASLRFFPLLPALARALSVLPGVGVGAAVVVVANASALVGAVAVVGLVRWESGDSARAGRAAWLVCLVPPAFTLVMGYAEGTLLALAVVTFFALRTRHWWWAAALGLAAGLTRPIGALLLIPAAVEVLRGLPATTARERMSRGAAVVGPVVGTGAFLGWVGWRYGDALTPLRLQTEGVHHGHFVDPLVTLGHDASFLVHGHHLGQALHLPWVLLVVALIVVCFRSWPASYGAFATAVVALALTGSNLDSFERYALSAFPLVLAGATVTASPRVRNAVVVVGAAGMAGYAFLAFTNRYVP